MLAKERHTNMETEHTVTWSSLWSPPNRGYIENTWRKHGDRAHSDLIIIVEPAKQRLSKIPEDNMDTEHAVTWSSLWSPPNRGYIENTGGQHGDRARSDLIIIVEPAKQRLSKIPDDGLEPSEEAHCRSHHRLSISSTHGWDVPAAVQRLFN